ncbi:SRPBCC family protein [Saccharibacillus alkalitolerans]|uniref:SRPBCC family protein n=1 Tax=Saccharibacillus alkalitolerans TaxID=2705290 RepID=A0ABX0FAK9_9BACL|nr:SRPBCC family protein [Saccharibacillus alkalitolerans]NGZ76514.1 SRPBCC family protein [Saccharibacillus alkalitolerans]
MLAVIEPKGSEHTARFERRLTHSVEQAWSCLTENERLKQWFPELRVEHLRRGGSIRFDTRDGNVEHMRILECKERSVLEYTWGKGRVRFELYPKPYGCRLLLVETIREVGPGTPEDLAGWHVGLDLIEALLDGRTIRSRKENWQEWFGEYRTLVENRV